MSYFVGKKDTDMWFPVRLVDSVDSKTPEPGKATGDITVVYGFEAATGETGYAQGADFWKEQGSGNYWLAIGASEFTSAGKYIVNIECAGCDPVNFVVDARPPETNVVEMGGNSIAGNLITLTLKQLDIQNNAGAALIAKATAGNNYGADIAGAGTGHGVLSTGGATGSGIKAIAGATSGKGIWADGGTLGNGLFAVGRGAEAGFKAEGGPTGHGLYCVSGGTSGDGIHAAAAVSGAGMRLAGGGNGHGLDIAGAGTGSGIQALGSTSGEGIYAKGGTTGNGIEAIGGATSGAGFRAAATNNNDAGMELVKHGTGKDLDADDLSEVTAARMGALTDWIDGGRLDLLLDLILADTGTDGVVLSAAQMNKIADHIIRRTFQNACDSADGDAKSFRSLLGAIAKLVNKLSLSGITLTITEDDDVTTLGTQTVTKDATAEPITGMDTV